MNACPALIIRIGDPLNKAVSLHAVERVGHGWLFNVNALTQVRLG
jgi:hypothetical protein